jgi:hypothetical protein
MIPTIQLETTETVKLDNLKKIMADSIIHVNDTLLNYLVD